MRTEHTPNMLSGIEIVKFGYPLDILRERKGIDNA